MVAPLEHCGIGRSGWRKSSRCIEGNCCVEVAMTDWAVAVRDSKDPSGPVLAFDPTVWQVFMDEVRAGMLDQR
jgi:Domain of unknown function (DUF397)